MRFTKWFKTKWAKAGLLAGIVGILRSLIALVRFLLDVMGEKEEAEKLKQYLPQILGAWWFAPLFLFAGFLVIYADYKSHQKPKSRSEMQRKQEVEEQINALTPAEKTIISLLRIHGTATPSQIVTDLRAKGFDEPEKAFNNLRGNKTLIVTVEGMSGSVGINPAMKEIVDETFEQEEGEEEQATASYKSWAAAFVIIAIFVGAVFAVHALVTKRRSSKVEVGPAKQASEAHPPTTPSANEPSHTVRPVPSIKRDHPEQGQLFVDCHSIQGNAAVPPEGIVRLLDLQEMPESVMKMDNLEEMTGKQGADFAGKDMNGFPIKVAECHITSYISGPIFNITATPHATFQEAVPKSVNARESGKVTLSRDWPIKIPKIDFGPDHAFVFYVMNGSNRFVSLSFPDKVIANVPGTKKQQTLQLIKAKELALMFSPIK